MRLIQKVAFLAMMAFVLSRPLAVRADPVGCDDSEAMEWCVANGPYNGYTCDYGTCLGSYSSCDSTVANDCLEGAANTACADSGWGYLVGSDNEWEEYCNVDCGTRGGGNACS